MGMSNIRKKFLIAFLAMGLVPFVVIAGLFLIYSNNTLIDQAFAQLESIREVKKSHIQGFFTERKGDMTALVEMVSALNRSAYRKLETVQDMKKSQLETYFSERISNVRVLAENVEFADALERFEAAFRDEGGKTGGALYRVMDAKYTPSFKKLCEEYDYYDLYLIDNNGNIIYTLIKEGDEGKNLLSEELNNTPLAKCFIRSLNGISIQDFEPYAPSGNIYSAFFSTPIYRDGEFLGSVALQILNDPLNIIVQRQKGMEETGETYILGKLDGKLSFRTDRMKGNYRVGDTIEDENARKVLKRRFPIRVKKHGEDVLKIFFYDRLDISGLKWVIVTSMGLEEAISPRSTTRGDDYFVKYVRQYGYDDLYLIHSDGEVFYSVARKDDYGTNIREGPYSQSGIGEVFKDVLGTSRFSFADFRPYAPSGGKPSAFIAQPVIHYGEIELVVILQIPIEVINSFMKVRSGMGESGETYLVGPDGLMRSDSHVNPNRYSVAASFKNPETGAVNTKVVEAALNNETGRDIITSYSGKKVLSTYTPIQVWDTKWALVAEIDKMEAFQMINMMKFVILAVGLITITFIIMISMIIAGHFANPIAKLTEGAQQVRARNFDTHIKVNSKDELEVLAEAFNSMVYEIRNYARILEEKVEERTRQLDFANKEIIALNERLKAENIRMSAELEITRKLQKMILPRPEELERIPGIDIAGFMEPAHEIGGDYYDVLRHNGRIRIGIGDVTGHGLESGVLMLMTQTAKKTLM